MASRAWPGSETETKLSPALWLEKRPTRCVSASQWWARNASVSVVVPDLVATRRSVRCGSTTASSAATASGCVESSTWSVSPLSDSGYTRARTSGASEEPPMPMTMASL